MRIKRIFQSTISGQVRDQQICSSYCQDEPWSSVKINHFTVTLTTRWHGLILLLQRHEYDKMTVPDTICLHLTAQCPLHPIPPSRHRMDTKLFICGTFEMKTKNVKLPLKYCWDYIAWVGLKYPPWRLILNFCIQTPK